MEAALSVCQSDVDSDSQCPLWSPLPSLEVLNCYMQVNDEKDNVSSLEHSVFKRTIRLCHALWSKLGDDDRELPLHMHDLGRKQLFSKWIKYETFMAYFTILICFRRMECRDNLFGQVKSAGIDNIDKINDCILAALCSGEVKLACQLAIITKQYRLSLLISQAANDLQGREVIRDQLSLWLQSRVRCQ